MNDAQTQVGFEGIEIAIGMEQLVTISDGVRGDEAVNRLAHGNAELAQGKGVASALQREIEHGDLAKPAQRPPCGLEIGIVAKALQHLDALDAT